MSPSYTWLILLVLTFAVVIAVATIRTKARHRRIRKALGLPARMETSSAEAQARQAVRVFQETAHRLSTTARRLSKQERRQMAAAPSGGRVALLSRSDFMSASCRQIHRKKGPPGGGPSLWRPAAKITASRSEGRHPASFPV